MKVVCSKCNARFLSEPDEKEVKCLNCGNLIQLEPIIDKTNEQANIQSNDIESIDDEKEDYSSKTTKKGRNVFLVIIILISLGFTTYNYITKDDSEIGENFINKLRYSLDAGNGLTMYFPTGTNVSPNTSIYRELSSVFENIEMKSGYRDELYLMTITSTIKQDFKFELKDSRSIMMKYLDSFVDLDFQTYDFNLYKRQEIEGAQTYGYCFDDDNRIDFIILNLKRDSQNWNILLMTSKGDDYLEKTFKEVQNSIKITPTNSGE